MKRLFLLTTGFCFMLFLSAQENPTPSTPTTSSKKKKDWSKVKIANRANDHFMLQYGMTTWANKPDSINTRGWSNSFNAYVMLDLPFKTDPRFSVAFGPGVGTDHIFFEKTNVTITNHLNRLEFQDLSDTTHFDKYKLVNVFLELPVEFRFSSNPENSNKSIKGALGFKVGVQVDAHTKGKRWVNKNGTIIPGFDDKYVQKNKDKYFFNGNPLVATARVGYGVFTIFGTYQITSLIKTGLGPQVRPWCVGLCLAGL